MEDRLTRARQTPARPAANQPQAWRQRGFWLQQVRRWHWISSALCLSCMLLFAGTGLTLNHADLFEPPARTEARTLALPPAELSRLATGPAEGAAPLPGPVANWARERLGVDLSEVRAEWSQDEVTASLPRPGGEQSLTIDRLTGAVRYETSNRGLVGTLNDLHTGRNSGPAWGWLIDVFAVGCLIFAATGLTLACLYAPGRPATWPLLAAGAAAPLVLALMIVAHLI